MVIAICSVLAAVGVPLIVIIALVVPPYLTLWLSPAGRLVIQLPDRLDLNVSFVKSTANWVSVIAVPTVPLTVTFPTAAEITGVAPIIFAGLFPSAR